MLTGVCTRAGARVPKSPLFICSVSDDSDGGGDGSHDDEEYDGAEEEEQVREEETFLSPFWGSNTR